MTAVVISQPMLFPWPGFMELASLADVYVHLDDAQFSKGSFTNRVQIKHPAGPKWMTIPLKGKGAFQPILELEADGDEWRNRHRELVIQSLRGAAHLPMALQLLDEVHQTGGTLADLLMASIARSVEVLGLARPSRWLRASQMGVDGAASERVLAIVKAVGGTRYVTAHGAANYLDHAAFEAAGVEVLYADYSLTPYAQQHGEFTPYVSILDPIANLGPEARAVVRPRATPWRQFLERRQAG